MGERTPLVLEHAHDAYLATDDRFRVTAWNLAAERLFGWAREDAVGQPLDEVLSSEAARDSAALAVHRSLESDAGSTDRLLELDVVDRRGRKLAVELSVSSLEAHGETSFHLFAREQSERRAAASARRLAAIVESSADAILVTDVQGTIIDWNPAAERLFGYSRAEIVGQPLATLVPGHLGNEPSALVDRARGGETITAYETERLRADGTIVDVEMIVTRIGASEDPLMCSAIYRDISARKRYERELSDRTRRLRSIPAAEPADELLSAGAPPRAGDLEPGFAARVVALMREHLGMDLAWICERSGDEIAFSAVAGTSRSVAVQAGELRPLAETPCAQMLAADACVIIGDTHAHPNLVEQPMVRAGLRAYAGVPVRLSDGRIFGRLCAASDRPRPELDERDLAFVTLLAEVLVEHIELSERVANRHRSASELTALSALLAALDARDHYTGEHSQAVVDLSQAVARALGVDGEEVVAVGHVALLHDLGKVGIPDAILQKPGPLSEAEWGLMREHPAIGGRIVASIGPLAHLGAAVRAEHERWDGTGYPDGRVQDEIPFAARVTFACDAYHAMISDRPYRASIGPAAAVAELRGGAGTQFDPAVVAALIDVLRG